MRRIGFEGWLLIVLVLAFAGGSLYYGARSGENLRDIRPTTHSTARTGLRAYLDLLRSEHIAAQRWEHNLTRLPRSAGLLVVAEPFVVPLQKEEQRAVGKWVRGGGTLLLIATKDDADTGSGLAVPDLTVEGGPNAARVITPDRGYPFTRDIAHVSVRGKDRLYRGESSKPGVPEWESVVARGDDVYVATASLGRGRLIVATPGAGLLNGDVGKADNAALYYNVARMAATTRRPQVLFDEYHQGFGFVESTGRTLWQAVGWPVRATFWYLLGVFAVALYSLNRRFGRPLPLPSPAPLGTADYVSSMAGLFRRAGAREVAIGEMQRACVLRLATRLGLAADTPVARLAEEAGRVLGLPADQMRDTLQRAAAIGEGAKVSEAEALALGRLLAAAMRRAELDGSAG